MESARQKLLSFIDKQNPPPRCEKCFGPLRRMGRFPFEGTSIEVSNELIRDIEYIRVWYKGDFWECVPCKSIVNKNGSVQKQSISTGNTGGTARSVALDAINTTLNA